MKLFTRDIIVRIAILLILCLTFAFAIMHGYVVCTGICTVFIAISVYNLFRYIQRISEEISHFIWSVRYTEFQNISGKIKHPHIPQKITDASREAVAHYKETLQAKESQLLYYQSLANNVDTAIIIISENNKIEWTNKAALRLLKNKHYETVYDLSEYHPELPRKLNDLRPGDINILPVKTETETYQLAISGMEFTVKGRTLMAVSIQNIRSALESKEIESWEKLIRVITHEIMNSITPIISLSGLLSSQLSEEEKPSAEEIKEAIATIHRRSEGISRFVETYRKITRIPPPLLEVVYVDELLNGIKQLFPQPAVKIAPIHTRYKLFIIADKNQIEQVLINLVTNGLQASEKTRKQEVILSGGYNTDGKPYICVEDNGIGILPNVIEHIFVPFFTTKNNGSGIGLSLSHQIMYRHKGNISVESEPDKGSRFILHFPPT